MVGGGTSGGEREMVWMGKGKIKKIKNLKKKFEEEKRLGGVWIEGECSCRWCFGLGCCSWREKRGK